MPLKDADSLQPTRAAAQSREGTAHSSEPVKEGARTSAPQGGQLTARESRALAAESFSCAVSRSCRRCRKLSCCDRMLLSSACSCWTRLKARWRSFSTRAPSCMSNTATHMRNLTVLNEPGQEDTADFLAHNKVRL